jgi:hypothetical protein
MTEIPSQESDLDHPPNRCRALPLTVTAGMPVVEVSDAMPATIVGFTQAFCIYRIDWDALDEQRVALFPFG